MDESLTTPGTLLMGKYRVERVLGQGAMGVVVAATHLGFGRQVAMKFMLPGKGTSPERHERFLREARIAAQLTSAHAAKVLDVGTMEGTGTPYLVMELLDGQDLDAVLDQSERGVLPFAEAVSYVLQVIEAVAEAHRAGIVHRDLKPANLFLARFADGSPCVKVLDFGVSKLIEPGVHLTQDTAVLGSPLYMSPEQMQASRDVDARSDVWALGIVLYQLVAGITPFHGEGIQQVCSRVFFAEPTPLCTFRAGAPAGFEAVLLRCFEKRREQRWQNVAELAAALVPFAPARAIVHAERAAAILGVNDKPAHATYLLPPEAPTTASPWAPARSEAVRGTLDTAAKPDSAPQRSSSRRRPLVALGLGVVALVLAIAGVALSRARAKAAPTPALSDTSTLGPTAPVPSSQPTAAPSSPASSAVPDPAPATSAAASAKVVASPPRVPTQPLTSPVHVSAPAKATAAPPKKNVLDRN
jgi:eukaryotic-like serine/threonine-protein kinase